MIIIYALHVRDHHRLGCLAAVAHVVRHVVQQTRARRVTCQSYPRGLATLSRPAVKYFYIQKQG